MRKQNAQNIQDILKDFMQENPAIRSRIMENRVVTAWNTILGPSVKHYTRSVFVKNKVLHVSLNSSVLRNELMMSKEKLVKSLNDYCEGEAITEIRFH